MRPYALLSALLLAGCVMPPERIAPEDLAAFTLADRFERHAFYDDSAFGGTERRLMKWREPPIITAADAPTIEALRAGSDALDAAVADIHEATGMPLELARSGTLMLIAGSPQKILSVSRKFTPSDSGVGTCGGNLYYDLGNPGPILRAIVYFRDDQPADNIPICIAQEMTQAMGLPADIDGAGDTVMDTYSTLDRLTEIDKKLLTILYDPRLKPGMTRQEAMPIVRQIIAEKGW